MRRAEEPKAASKYVANLSSEHVADNPIENMAKSATKDMAETIEAAAVAKEAKEAAAKKVAEEAKVGEKDTSPMQSKRKSSVIKNEKETLNPKNNQNEEKQIRSVMLHTEALQTEATPMENTESSETDPFSHNVDNLDNIEDGNILNSNREDSNSRK